MNKLAISLSILFIIVLTSITGTIRAINSCTCFLNQLNKIEQNLNLNEFQNVKNQMQTLNQNYNKHANQLQLILNRDYVKKIKKNLDKLNSNLFYNNKSGALQNISNIKTTIKMLKGESLPNIYNIL